MFGNTHSFLPKRNGMVPNTAHILLHLSTASTLLVLYYEGIHGSKAFIAGAENSVNTNCHFS